MGKSSLWDYVLWLSIFLAASAEQDIFKLDMILSVEMYLLGAFAGVVEVLGLVHRFPMLVLFSRKALYFAARSCCSYFWLATHSLY